MTTNPTNAPSDTFSPSSTQQAPSSYYEPSSDEGSSAGSENTTKGEEPSAQAPESTTAPGETSTESPSHNITVPVDNEYDILRTGEFSFVGVITGNGEPMEVNMSLGKEKIYITSDMDGLEIGMYFEGNKTYIYAPGHKKYLRMSSTVIKLLGLDTSQFTNMADDLGFDRLPPLSSATSVGNGSVNGAACEIYTFSSGSAKDMYVRVYMSGKKLIKIEYADQNNKADTSITFKSITANFPKMPPDGFSEMGYIEFFRLISDEMQ